MSDVIHPGTQRRILHINSTGAGQDTYQGVVGTDAVLVTLWVESISGGSLNVNVYTLTDTGKETLLFSFPSINAPTGQLLLRKSGVTLQTFKVVAAYSGACSFEMYARSVNTAGESSVRLVGATNMETDSVTVTSVPAPLLPSSLSDRSGVAIMNWSGTGTLWVADSPAKIPNQAWPIPPGGGWSLDVAAGVVVYAASDGSDLDVRIVQAGG